MPIGLSVLYRISSLGYKKQCSDLASRLKTSSTSLSYSHLLFTGTMEPKDSESTATDALGLAKSTDSQYIVQSPVDERTLVKKIDLFLLPTIWLMYLLSYIDRTKSVLPCLPGRQKLSS